MKSFIILLISVIAVGIVESRRPRDRDSNWKQATTEDKDFLGSKPHDASNSLFGPGINADVLNFKVNIEFKSTGGRNVAKMVVDCADSRTQSLPVFDPSDITDCIVNNAEEHQLERLVRFLKPLTNLNTLFLNNTKFSSDYEFQERITLPKLRKFVLNHNCEKRDYSKHVNPIKKSKFRSWFFFDKGTEWDFNNLIDLKVNTRYSLSTGYVPFDLNYDDQEMVSIFEFLNEDILSNIPNNFQLKGLGLYRPLTFGRDPMFVNVDWIPSSLKFLSLIGINLVGGDLVDIFGKCRDVERVSLRIANYTNPIELDIFPSTLKELSVNSHTLENSAGIKLNLESLKLRSCKLEPPILVENFENSFTVRDISIGFPLEESSITYSILAKVMKSDVTLQINVKHIDRESTSVKYYDEVETALINCGTPRDRTSFILFRNDDDGQWIFLI